MIIALVLNRLCMLLGFSFQTGSRAITHLLTAFGVLEPSFLTWNPIRDFSAVPSPWTALVAICAIYYLRGIDLIPDIINSINGAILGFKITVFSATAFLTDMIYYYGIILMVKKWKRPLLPAP